MDHWFTLSTDTCTHKCSCAQRKSCEHILVSYAFKCQATCDTPIDEYVHKHAKAPRCPHLCPRLVLRWAQDGPRCVQKASQGLQSLELKLLFLVYPFSSYLNMCSCPQGMRQDGQPLCHDRLPITRNLWSWSQAEWQAAST